MRGARTSTGPAPFYGKLPANSIQREHNCSCPSNCEILVSRTGYRVMEHVSLGMMLHEATGCMQRLGKLYR